MLAQLSDVQSRVPVAASAGDHDDAGETAPNHKILGVVLNGLKPRDGSAYYGRYGYDYHSGHAIENRAA